MTSLKYTSDATEEKANREAKIEQRELTELPPSGTSLHRRRRGEPPATLSVKSPQTPSDAEGSSPCTGPTPEDWVLDEDITDPESFCDRMLQKLKDKDDVTSKRGRVIASQTKDTLEALDQLEKLLELLDQFVSLKERNNRLLKKLQDVEQLKQLHNAYKNIVLENEKLKDESKELELINEALNLELEYDYGQALFDSMLTGGRSMKRSGSKWKSHGKFGGSLLRKQRSRSAGGEDDLLHGAPLRRRSDFFFSKEVEKSKVSNWTRVKAAFKWEKAQWPASTIGGAAAVAAGAMVGAVALAGSSPSSALANPEHDSASLTPGSAISLTPNSSCEELRLDTGMHRKSIAMRIDDQEHSCLHAPVQDDSSASPSPNKLNKGPWGKMRDIIQTRRDSVKKKGRTAKSPDIVLTRRKSFSDGGESDAPPALTLTIPSSEELESEGSHHVLRKQRSLELGARPPQRPRDSKWTRVKRAFLTSASASMPSSPNRHSAFFTDAETEGMSSGYEGNAFREEIARDFAALQTRLGREISDRRGKLNIHITKLPSRPVATEDELSADFHKKLTEWRTKGQQGKQPPPIPARKDLSEDFLKKWDEWQRMKETNSVPAWEDQTKPDEVLVQTSTGLFKFQGISRSFTRRLHEWEKSQGIAPEVSTTALLRAARAGGQLPAALTRTQSDGSVGPIGGVNRVHVSSLSVNDVDDLDAEFDRERLLVASDECKKPREAVLVEVEAEEICTAAPLVAVSPRHTPQKPVYTYGQAEPRLLCETSSAVTGTAVLQPNGTVPDIRTGKSRNSSGSKIKSTREQVKTVEKSTRRRISRQTSLEEDAKFIRQTIQEIERGSRCKESVSSERDKEDSSVERETIFNFNPKSLKQFDNLKEAKNGKDSDETKDEKRKEFDKGNSKKKTKTRARLEREQSKPSESDTEPEVDTVTVEIPRRKKRARRPSERPRTPPTSLHSDSEGEVFVLKLKASEVRDTSPEVIVKTTRKIFSPVIRSGETIPRAVIPLDVEDLPVVRARSEQHYHLEKTKPSLKDSKSSLLSKGSVKSSGDLQDEEQKPRSKPPLPLSPPSQRKPPPKETAPSIRIMIQRYNKKINEDGPPSGGSSGTTSPSWRSPKLERRRPPDMPVGVNIRNNPFLEREVHKSASACQLSRRDHTSAEISLAVTDTETERVLKSHSANALHPEQADRFTTTREDSLEFNILKASPSTETIIPKIQNTIQKNTLVMRQSSEVAVPTVPRLIDNIGFGRSISIMEDTIEEKLAIASTVRLSERAAKIKAARERFLASPPLMRREGTNSATDLRPGDRSSRISCENEATERAGPSQEGQLGRSASTGMVNVEREVWQRVNEGVGGQRSRGRSRFSLARLAAILRRKEESAVSRLCRQSLLVQLRNK